MTRRAHHYIQQASTCHDLAKIPYACSLFKLLFTLFTTTSSTYERTNHLVTFVEDPARNNCTHAHTYKHARTRTRTHTHTSTHTHTHTHTTYHQLSSTLKQGFQVVFVGHSSADQLRNLPYQGHACTSCSKNIIIISELRATTVSPAPKMSSFDQSHACTSCKCVWNWLAGLLATTHSSKCTNEIFCDLLLKKEAVQ